MDRKAVARQTLEIMEKGFYDWNGTQVMIKEAQKQSVQVSPHFNLAEK